MCALKISLYKKSNTNRLLPKIYDIIKVFWLFNSGSLESHKIIQNYLCNYCFWDVVQMLEIQN